MTGHEEAEDVETTLVTTPRRSDARQLVNRLRELGWTLATAESITGGQVASLIVAEAGSSSVFRGGVVAYATELKANLLGVEEHLLEAHGPVHPRVARQMAEGVRRVTRAEGRATDVGIATTGIAGPESPDGQPVGTVVVAVSTPLGSRVETLLLEGDRNRIRSDAAVRALRLTLEAL